jgi:hypothetical protein
MVICSILFQYGLVFLTVNCTSTLNNFQGLKNAVAEFRLCSRMEELVLKKKSIHPGDSLKTHFEKA